MKNLRPLAFLALALFALSFASTHAAAQPQLSDNSLARFTSQGHVLGFRTGEFFISNATYALRVAFVGANAVTPQSDSPTSTDLTVVPPLSRVTYTNLWDGITLTYDAAHGGVVSSNYRLAPNADPHAIRLHYNAPVTLNHDGTLTIAYATGEMVESAPIAWQDIHGRRLPIPVAFSLQRPVPNSEAVAFAVGAYDVSQPLFIDPTLTWNTFLGGSGADHGSGIATDSSGYVYVCGFRTATWGSPIRAFNDHFDAFAARLDSSGGLTWNMFLGGVGFDVGSAIAIDTRGNVYVAGQSNITWGSPVRAFPVDRAKAFAAKINNTPTSPIPVFPQDGDLLHLLKFTLEWKCLPCVGFFKLKIKDTTTGKIFLNQPGIKDTQFELSGLKRGHTYSWQLKACNTIGCTKGPKFHFTIAKSASSENQ